MKNQQGFTLVETLVALVILGLIALMAEKGLSSAFRVKDTVENEIALQDQLLLMMKYLKNDCEATLKNADQKLPPTFIKGNQFAWFYRHYSSRAINGWQFIGYTVDGHVFKRYVSQTYANKPEADLVLKSLVKDPDLGLPSTQLTYQLPDVMSVDMQALWSPVSNASPLGIDVAIFFNGKTNPMRYSCIVEGNL
jgi:prepilin-type N-terminal cleavage/methylation domain-containing protein